jgi:hypothetical protein
LDLSIISRTKLREVHEAEIAPQRQERCVSAIEGLKPVANVIAVADATREFAAL